ncbi:MAG: transporter [Jatrophihabitantaceae bacterium]
MTRLLLTSACVLFIGLLLLAMLWGWRNRIRQQAMLPELPAAPDELGAALLSPLAGVYVGTTFAPSWQERVVHAGLGMQSQATITRYRDGLLIDRVGADALFIATQAIVQARLAPGLAGKVVGTGGLLVVRWHLGQTELDSGFRADDKSSYPDWVRAINGKVLA